MADEHDDVAKLLDTLEQMLDGPRRAEILDELSRTGDFADSLRRLRNAMSAHAFGTAHGEPRLEKIVRRLDRQTWDDGFRVLHSWDHNTHRFTEDIVPVLMLDFYGQATVRDPNERVTLEILLDYYFLHLLALAAMRAWDSGDPDATFGRLTGLVETLQGSSGSGHHFVADAETLLIYALSQFHPEEQSYARIIEKVVTLSEPRQIAFAKVSVAVLSAHLRWGFWLMYERDPVRMRRDNVGDYPWLLNSVLTLMRAYAAEPGERADITESLLQGFAADPWAFTSSRPSALADLTDEYEELSVLLKQHGTELLEDLETHRPTKESYSPLALHFNFPHNTLVAILTLALLEGRPQALSLNDLFIRERSDLPDEETQEGLARMLMAFSRGSPDRLGYQGAMLVAYDPLSGMRSFSLTRDALRKSLT